MDQEHMLQFFGPREWPLSLQGSALSFLRCAEEIIATIPRNPERTVALRKLLESKDALIRAASARPA